MTTQAMTKISYANAYSSVVSTAAVGAAHPGNGWFTIAQALVARIASALRTRAAQYRAAQAQHAAAQGAMRILRMAADLQASQPSLANELIAIASRDHK